MDSEHTNDDNSRNKRKCTDIYAPIVLLALFFLVIAYCIIYTDLSILTKGRDDCGNVCGELNDVNEQCGQHDMRDYPKLLIQRQKNAVWLNEFKCVSECPINKTEYFIQCWQQGDALKIPNFQSDYGWKLYNFSKFTRTFWIAITVYCALTFVLSCAILILLRFMPQATVWVVPILLTAILFLISFVNMIFSFDSPNDGIESSLFLYVGFYFILMMIFVKKIILVARIFKETAKWMMQVPWIAILPILTFIILTIFISTFLFTSLLIESSGTFTSGSSEDGKFQLKYEDTKLMKVARIINIFTFFWLGNFVINCQHFVVAGTVTKWYFTRDKSGMGGVSQSSMFNLVRFHLGSVCFGSIAVPVVRLIHFGLRVAKICFKYLQSERIDQEFDFTDRMLGAYSTSAYILIEKDGTSFLESGKTSYELLLENLGDVYWLNLIRDISLFLNQMFVPFLGMFFGIFIIDSKSNEHIDISPVTVNLTFTFLIAHCFFMAYGMTIDAILISFCIDCKENDGDARPYFMSEELKKISIKIRKNCGLEPSFVQNEGAEEPESNMIPMMSQ